MANSITADEIREQFSQAMSAMYQQEVPQYGTLLELVADVNLAVLENNPQLHEKMVNADELARLNVERHGAIRVGTAQELATLRRMFAIMGMYPVSYYDLSQAGVPVHSTAFRPIDDASLARNPFRVFTSLLRLELIENEILRQKAAEILRQRDIFTPRCRQLLEEYEQQGGFNETQAQEFVQEALETFRWHQSATVDDIARNSRDYYQLLRPYFFGARNELLCLLCMDGKHKVLGIRRLGEGNVNAVAITTRLITEAALALNAAAVVLAHNHVSGIAFPSEDDIATTRSLAPFLAKLGVELVDHLIFVDDDMVSLRDSGFYQP